MIFAPKKQWESKTICQTAACAKLFFVEMLDHKDWTVFSQIRTKDREKLPAVLTRQEVCKLLEHGSMRRYRTPLKLIYCCGLRISECLGLTIHDIKGEEGKLWVRDGKGLKDRANGGAPRMETVSGVEFVTMYLRHVLPKGMRAVRQYGFCHPAAKSKREKIAFLTGRPLLIGALSLTRPKPERPPKTCTC